MHPRADGGDPPCRADGCPILRSRTRRGTSRKNMTRRAPRICDLYRNDLERHLFAPETRNRRRLRINSSLADWLRVTAAILAWALSSGR
jgi:hypothetical protein